MKKNQEPTCTSLVMDELCGAADFRSMPQLCEATRLSTARVSAALYHLRQHKSVEFISDASGTWWFATPESDDRCRCVDKRAPEIKPRKPRKAAPK